MVRPTRIDVDVNVNVNVNVNGDPARDVVAGGGGGGKRRRCARQAGLPAVEAMHVDAAHGVGPCFSSPNLC